MRVALVMLLVVAGAAASAQAGSKPYSARPTAACLAGHRVLATQVPKSQAPPGIPAVAVVQMSFALIPALAISNGQLLFENSPATAKSIRTRWIAYAVTQAEQVQGIDQQQAKRIIESELDVHGNVVIVWAHNTGKAGARRLVASCLR